MCQFARTYPLSVLRSFIDTDVRLSVPNIQNVTNEVLKLNDKQFTQELTAQMQSTDCQSLEFTQEAPAQIQDVEKTVSAIYRMGIMEIEKIFLNSPVARINWASQMVILDGSLPLGIGYWYMKQSVEMGWSSNVLKIQIETNLYSRQISNNKVNNFTATLPAVEILRDVSYSLSAAFRSLSARSHRPPLNTVSSSSVNPPTPPFPSMPLSLL